MYFECSNNLNNHKNKELIEKSNYSSFVISIFEVSNFRNIGRYTFGRSKFWPPPPENVMIDSWFSQLQVWSTFTILKKYAETFHTASSILIMSSAKLYFFILHLLISQISRSVRVEISNSKILEWLTFRIRELGGGQNLER